MKEWGAEHVSILTHKREEEEASDSGDGDVVEEDSLRLPPFLSPGSELVLPADATHLRRRRVPALATRWNLARLVVMVIDTWSPGRLLLANRQPLVVCLGRGRSGSCNGGAVCLDVPSVFSVLTVDPPDRSCPRKLSGTRLVRDSPPVISPGGQQAGAVLAPSPPGTPLLSVIFIASCA